MSEENIGHQTWNSEEQRKQMARAVNAEKSMFGRTMILTSAGKITSDNVVKIVSQAYQTHLKNREEIDYLWRYYKGDRTDRTHRGKSSQRDRYL